MTIAFRLESQELPRLLNATGHISLPPPPIPGSSKQQYDDDEERPRIDYSPLKEFDLRLCYGKEWYRFPGHYLIPDGIRVDWVKSEFDGMLPGHFVPSEGGLVERIKGTKTIPTGLNDLNRETPQFYVRFPLCIKHLACRQTNLFQVDVSTCDYLIDLDFPLHPRAAPHEPRYVTDTDTWDKVTCHKFLDAQHSSLLTRTLWMPGSRWQEPNEFGEYCLLKHKANVVKKEKRHKVPVKT